MLCAVNAEGINGPIFYAERNEYDRYVGIILAELFLQLREEEL
jgi:hypothetical protein